MGSNPTSWMRNYMQNYRIDLSTDMKKSLGGRCAKCGDKRLNYLQFHHKVPICRGRGFDNLCLVGRDYNNLPLRLFKTKYQLLCDKCHGQLNSKQTCKKHLF